MAGPRQLQRAAFQFWLRTGRVPTPPVEYKFNGWHDPDDGRFTYVGAGRYFPPGSSSAAGSVRLAMARPPRRPEFGGGAGASGSWESARPGRQRPGDREGASRTFPLTEAARSSKFRRVYVVQTGDTLSALAKGEQITVAQLAAANDISDPDRVDVGQELRIPTRVAARPDWVAVQVQGLKYELDRSGRTRLVEGDLGTDHMGRSKKLQAQAGGADRRRSDDGGHFIAPRFGGPKEAYNHFAQDANFNRGAYRVLENEWAGAQRKGEDVRVSIDVRYSADSRRPYQLTVSWTISGDRKHKVFSNTPGGRVE